MHLQILSVTPLVKREFLQNVPVVRLHISCPSRHLHLHSSPLLGWELFRGQDARVRQAILGYLLADHICAVNESTSPFAYTVRAASIEIFCLDSTDKLTFIRSNFRVPSKPPSSQFRSRRQRGCQIYTQLRFQLLHCDKRITQGDICP